MARIVFIGLFIMFPSFAFGGGNHGNGNELLKYCTKAIEHLDHPDHPGTNEEYSGAGFCIGYVAAMIDIAPAFLPGNVCLPDDITRNQAIRVVTKFLNDHPEGLRYPSYELSLDAFLKAFPCKQGNKKKKVP